MSTISQNKILLTDIIAPSFYSVDWDILDGKHTYYDLYGGRGSTKPSFISAEIVLGIMQAPLANAIVFRKYGVTLRESVFEQIDWAIEELGVSELWAGYTNPMRFIYKPTGQKIIFRGLAKAKKTKSIKATRYANQNGLSGKEEKESIGKNVLGVGSGGSASYEGKYIGKIDYEEAPEAVRNFNGQIKDETVENAVVIDKSGKVYQFMGDSKSVNISGIYWEGAYITHNHPKSEGIVSFGEDDFMFLRSNQNIKLFGCCNEKYEYEIEVLKDFSKLLYNEIYLEGFKIADMADFEAQDAAMKVLEERGFIRYVKREIE